MFGVLIELNLVFLSFFLFRFLSISVSLRLFLLFFDWFVLNRVVHTRRNIRQINEIRDIVLTGVNVNGE